MKTTVHGPRSFQKARLEQFNIPLLEIDLNILSRQSLREFTETYLKGPISGDFFKLLQRTTNGNPFYLEQLLEYFTENDLLEKVDDNWHIEDNNIKLSNSIHALLTARIDRLSSLVKETVKAAAVIGREFEVPVLSEVMRQQEAFLTNNDNPQHLLQEQIKTAENSQIWRAINELRYIFKHSLLREAVYDMQLRTRLRELHHLIAEAIEKVYADQIEQHFVDLAFHYEHAEMEAETREYLLKAADHARHNFQNNQALHYYNKLLQHLRNNQEEVEEFKVLLKKGKVLELIGEWEECLKIYNKALAIAQEQSDKLLLGRSNNALGHLLLLQGAYKDARLYLELAARFFEDIRDQYGISKVYGDLGNLYFRQGEYEEAKSNFIRSIQLHRKLPESSATNQSQIVANLGLTFMNQGQYEEGIQWLEQELVYAEQTGNKQAMASLYTNLGIICFEKGDYDKAKQCYEKGLPLAEELGNKQLTSIAMGCLGSVYEKQGNYEKAMTNFQRDLELAEELGDRQGTAIALSLLGELYSVIGRFDEAVEKLHRTLSISESLGYQKGIAKAVNTLGDVYYFTGQYDKAVSSYQRAIEGARQINNKLVLGNSLYEIGLVFLAMNRLEDTREAYEEAQHLAEELGNPDLRFDIRSLGAQLLHGEGKKEEAIRELNSMLSDAQDAQQEAEVHYQLYRVTDSPASRAQALIFYRRLYEETPKFVYKERIDRLQP
jgi:tetratricopeptide (TPR) repeat protein